MQPTNARSEKYFRATRDTAACLLLLACLLFFPGRLSHAQSPNCDEGVIRLADRNGTIQLCSAISAKLPALVRQLNESTARIAKQDAALSELTRLVRGLNNVSRSIGFEKQTNLAETLLSEIRQSEQRGDEAMLRRFSDMTERLDELQGQLLSALSDPKKAATVTTELQGSIGESISRLEFASASRQLAAIEARLARIEAGVADVKADTAAIRDTAGSIDSRTQRIESTLSDVAGTFGKLAQAGGLIVNPTTPEEHYFNALLYFERGQLRQAESSMEQYLTARLDFIDPVEAYVQILQNLYPEKVALEKLRAQYTQNPSRPLQLYLVQLQWASHDLNNVTPIDLARLFANRGQSGLPFRVCRFQTQHLDKDIEGNRNSQELADVFRSNPMVEYSVAGTDCLPICVMRPPTRITRPVQSQDQYIQERRRAPIYTNKANAQRALKEFSETGRIIEGSGESRIINPLQGELIVECSGSPRHYSRTYRSDVRNDSALGNLDLVSFGVCEWISENPEYLPAIRLCDWKRLDRRMNKNAFVGFFIKPDRAEVWLRDIQDVKERIENAERQKRQQEMERFMNESRRESNGRLY
jgi:hypothetical protein